MRLGKEVGNRCNNNVFRNGKNVFIISFNDILRAQFIAY